MERTLLSAVAVIALMVLVVIALWLFLRETEGPAIEDLGSDAKQTVEDAAETTRDAARDAGRAIRKAVD